MYLYVKDCVVHAVTVHTCSRCVYMYSARDYISSTVYVHIHVCVYTCIYIYMYTQVCRTTNHRTEVGVSCGQDTLVAV